MTSHFFIVIRIMIRRIRIKILLFTPFKTKVNSSENMHENNGRTSQKAKTYSMNPRESTQANSTMKPTT